MQEPPQLFWLRRRKAMNNSAQIDIMKGCGRYPRATSIQYTNKSSATAAPIMASTLHTFLLSGVAGFIMHIENAVISNIINDGKITNNQLTVKENDKITGINTNAIPETRPITFTSLLMGGRVLSFLGSSA